MKKELRNFARKMRLEGCSLKEISKSLSVAPSTVSLWVKDIVLTEDQRSNLNCRIVENGRKLGKIYGKLLKNKFDTKANEFRKNGYEKIESDIEFRTICAMYWGEGAKTYNVVNIANSDFSFIRVFISWLAKVVPTKNIKYSVQYHINNNLSECEIVNLWLTNVPLLSQCVSNQHKAIQSTKVCKRKCLQGTCTVYAKKSSKLFFEIMGGIDRLKTL